MPQSRILVVRLGAMGDVIHALPAASSLKRSLEGARITWIVDPRWAPLLEGNPDVDDVLEFDRRSWSSVRSAWDALRRARFDIAVDLQGLMKSALIAAASGAPRRIGFSRKEAREPLASSLYTQAVVTSAAHVVDRNLELACAAGADRTSRGFPLPPGRPEGDLPAGRFVLACPLAGWVSKQWPLEHYSEVAAALNREGCALVVNGPPAARETLTSIAGAHAHVSGVAGLIDATRRAAGILGVDSGPLHLAAALRRPGVAIFGPTDPARNGPYGGTFTVLRLAGASTTYKRGREISPEMRAIRPAAVVEALRARLAFDVKRTSA